MGILPRVKEMSPRFSRQFLPSRDRPNESTASIRCRGLEGLLKSQNWQNITDVDYHALRGSEDDNDILEEGYAITIPERRYLKRFLYAALGNPQAQEVENLEIGSEFNNQEPVRYFPYCKLCAS
ncbi:hypothetical protein FQA39_LY03172 [Lamprigera yunnana]|nr:hypothetical protein FQA39_LY03172 [Lamprigera yunnana]